MRTDQTPSDDQDSLTTTGHEEATTTSNHSLEESNPEMVLYTVPVSEEKGLPSLDVQIAHLPATALLDCASTLNLAHEDFLLHGGVDISNPLPSRVLIRGITGNTSKPQGEIDLPVRVGDAVSRGRFVITTAQFPGNALLGYNLLKALKLLVDFGRGEVYTDRLSQTRLIDGLVGMTDSIELNSVHPRLEAIGLEDSSRTNPTSLVTGNGENREVVNADSLHEAVSAELTVNVMEQGSTLSPGVQGNDSGGVESNGDGTSYSVTEPTLQDALGGVLLEAGQDTRPSDVADIGLSLTEVPLPQGNVLEITNATLSQLEHPTNTNTNANTNTNPNTNLDSERNHPRDTNTTNISITRTGNNHEELASDGREISESFDEGKAVMAYLRQDCVLRPNEATVVKLEVPKLANTPTVLLLGDTIVPHNVICPDGFTECVAGSFSAAAYTNLTMPVRLKAGTAFIKVAISEAQVFVIDGQPSSEDSQTSSNQADRDKLDQELVLKDFPEVRQQVLDLLQKNRGAVAVGTEKLGRTDVIKHSISLIPGTSPRYIPAYRLPHSRKQVAEDLVEEMKQDGIVRASSSPFNSPLILIPKPDGSFRPCVDYRALNAITVPDRFPMPVLGEILQSLGDTRIFSNLDLLSGYWQIGLEEESKPLTAFSTPREHLEFEVMPFGLCNAPSTFSRLMSQIFRDLEGNQMLCYLDDILIFSKDVESHLRALDEILQRLQDAGLKLKLRKCKFFGKQIKFLGHVISDKGIGVQEEKVEAIANFPIPKDQKGLKRFLGMAGYYRPFVANFSKIAYGLTKLLKKDTPYVWAEEQDEAFNHLKQKLMSAPILCYPDFKKPFIIATDASDTGIGAVLLQKEKRKYMPIAFASRALNPTEQRYSVTQREALAVVWGLRKFRDTCLGYPVTILTDHQPVLGLFKGRNLTGKLARWFLQIQEMEPEMKYIPGTANTIADALSRVHQPPDEGVSTTTKPCYTISVQQVELDLDLIRTEQEKDADYQQFLQEYTRNPTRYEEYEYIDGILFKRFSNETKDHLCICVPKTLRTQVLHILHSHRLSGHPGPKKTKKQAKRNYFWQGMASDVDKYIRQCEICLAHKGRPNAPAPLEQYPSTLEPWEYVGMDFIGPFPTSERGCRHILVFIDYLSRYCEIVPTKDRTAVTVAEALRHRIITRHSCPRVLVSDNAREFVSELFDKLCTFYDIKKVTIVPYKPSSNGLVERANQKLLCHLRTLVSPLSNNWDRVLDDVQVGINTTVNESTGETPHFILYGVEKRLPTSLMIKDPEIKPLYNYEDYVETKTRSTLRIISQTRRKLEESAVANKKSYDKKTKPATPKVGQKVYVLKHLKEGPLFKVSPRFEGPYRIIEILKHNKCRVKSCQDQTVRVTHWNHLKVCSEEIVETNNDLFIPQAEQPRPEEHARKGPRTRSQTMDASLRTPAGDRR